MAAVAAVSASADEAAPSDAMGGHGVPAGIDPEEGSALQCRFCLQEDDPDALIAPCKCVGTGKYVHEHCLRRWQEEVRDHGDDRAVICQLCQSRFSLKPPPPRDHLAAHNRDRRSDYPPGPLFDHISTNPYFDSSAVRHLPAHTCRQLLASMVPGCLVLHEPTASTSVIRWEHWHKGAFLIGGVWPGQGHGSSGALIGVNLAGARVPNPDAFSADGPLRELQTYLAQRSVALSFVIGGPVQPRAFLVLVAVAGVLAEVTLHPRVRRVYHTSSPGTASGSEPAPSPLLRRISATAAASRGREETSRETPPPRCDGALFGEPGDVVQALRGASASHLRPVAAVAFQGHAVWSSTQLLAEIARGSWCLAHASPRELALVSPLEEREEMWRRLFSTKPLLHGTYAPRVDDPVRPGCGCVVS
eukprot:TRINITY_DN1552_c0_g3_i1.p1 TRINITY_DN1552_c0_g3~~TRINITY_DN1552_c0_g3_i1.p1  ORF type:complete len:417 (-),score=61.92 TRINITY_DN1552_c0_g3_i1:141-1391(-)